MVPLALQPFNAQQETTMGLFSKLTKGIGSALKSLGSVAKKVAPAALSFILPGIGGAVLPLLSSSAINPILGDQQTSSAPGGFDFGSLLNGALSGALGGALGKLNPPKIAPPQSFNPGALQGDQGTSTAGSSLLPLALIGIAAFFFFRP